MRLPNWQMTKEAHKNKSKRSCCGFFPLWQAVLFYSGQGCPVECLEMAESKTAADSTLGAPPAATLCMLLQAATTHNAANGSCRARQTRQGSVRGRGGQGGGKSGKRERGKNIFAARLPLKVASSPAIRQQPQSNPQQQ